MQNREIKLKMARKNYFTSGLCAFHSKKGKNKQAVENLEKKVSHNVVA